MTPILGRKSAVLWINNRSCWLARGLFNWRPNIVQTIIAGIVTSTISASVTYTLPLQHLSIIVAQVTLSLGLGVLNGSLYSRITGCSPCCQNSHWPWNSIHVIEKPQWNRTKSLIPQSKLTLDHTKQLSTWPEQVNGLERRGLEKKGCITVYGKGQIRKGHNCMYV